MPPLLLRTPGGGGVQQETLFAVSRFAGQRRNVEARDAEIGEFTPQGEIDAAASDGNQPVRAETPVTVSPATEVDPVVVLGTRSLRLASNVPGTVSVIDAEQIETLLATDIKDLIRFEPGVSVPTSPARFSAALSGAGRDGNSGFTIRGMGGNRVLIIQDGVRVPDGFAFGAQSVGRGGYNDLDLTKSVEVLRGPASALYGSDGVAGAVVQERACEGCCGHGGPLCFKR